MPNKKETELKQTIKTLLLSNIELIRSYVADQDTGDPGSEYMKNMEKDIAYDLAPLLKTLKFLGAKDRKECGEKINEIYTFFGKQGDL